MKEGSYGFPRLFLQLSFTLYTCICVKLSFIDKTKNDTLVLTSYTAKASDFIWLQEVTEDPTKTQLKVFIRSHYKNFSGSSCLESRLEDPNRQLQLKAVEKQNLKCGIFYNKSYDAYFIHIFGDQNETQPKPIYLSPQMIRFDQNQTPHQRTFQLASSCDRVIIDDIKVYDYSYTSDFYKDQWTPEGITTIHNEWSLATDFSLTNTYLTGFDHRIQVAVTKVGDVYRLGYTIVNEYHEGESQTDGFYYYESNKYVPTMVYITSVEITNMTIEVASFLHDSTIKDEDISTSYYRILIFGFKEVDRNFNYTLVAIRSNQENFDDTNIISEEYDQAKTRPNFVYAVNLFRAIVYGARPNGDLFYDGYFYNYTEQKVDNIVFPSSITKNQWNLTISQLFLYTRTIVGLNGKFNQSAYIFAGQKLYPYFQEQTIQDSQYNNNLLYSFIKPYNLSLKPVFLQAQMTVFHVHLAAERTYYRVQTVDSFAKTQSLQQLIFYDMNFSVIAIPGQKQTSIISAQIGSRWIYATQDPSKNPPEINATVVSYERETRTLINSSLSLQSGTQFNLSKFMMSPNLDCFYFANSQHFSLDFYRVVDNKIFLVGYLQTDELKTAFPKSSKEIKISANCSKVQLLNKTYFHNQTTAVFDLKDISPLNFSTSFFDSNFNFAVQGQNLYKFNGSDYVQIFTYPFKQQSQILASDDGTKLLIRTYQNYTDEIVNSTTNKTTKDSYMLFDLVTLLSTNETWTQIKPQTKLTNVRITNFLSSLQTSATFQKALVCYVLNTTAAERICLVSIINQTLQKVYQSTYQFDSGRVLQVFNIKNNLIYIVDGLETTRSKTTVQYDCKQNLFGAMNNTLKLIKSFGVECKLYKDNFSKRQIIENDTVRDFYFLMQYVNQTTVLLVNRTSKRTDMISSSPTSQQLARGFFAYNSIYYECSPGCLQCQNLYFCTKCMSGYSLDIYSYTCFKCNGYCDACDTQNPSTCITCPLGFYYDKTLMTCGQCHQNCQTCNGKSIDKCTSCKIGYFLNKNIQKKKKKTCLPCPLNCDYCSNSTMCTTCQFGFSPASNGSCVKCPEDCSQCNPAQISNCAGCRNGFELVTVDGKSSCQKCPDLCEKCRSGKCQKCRTGATLNMQNNTCSKTCWSPCKQCSFTDPRSCTTCIGGYKLNGTLCVPDVSCSTNVSCVSCPSGYALIAKRCYECAIDINCAECHSFNPAKCVSCKEGYFLQGQDCKQCNSDSCIRCYAKTICQECKTGYFISQMNSTASLCIKCGNHCTACIESATNCLSCEEGYNLTGTSCVPVQSVNFTLKLNTDFNNFTSDIYAQLIKEVATLVGKSTSEIRIFSLKNGSVTVEGNIDSKNTTDESKILSLLNSGLGTGTKVAGQDVLVSQFVGYTPIATTTEESKPNLVLILSIAIPGALILVGVTVLILYKKCFAPKQMAQVARQSDRSSTQSDLSVKQKQKIAAKRPSKTSKDLFSTKKISRRQIQTPEAPSSAQAPQVDQ